MAVFHAGDLTGGITALDALEQYAERGTGAGIGLMLYRRQPHMGDVRGGKKVVNLTPLKEFPKGK